MRIYHSKHRLSLIALLATLVGLSAVTPAWATTEDPDPRPARPPAPTAEPAPKAGIAAPAVSTDELPTGFSSWEQLFDEQERLNLVADQILAAGTAGYAGIVVDPTNHDVRVYWKGALPLGVAAAVEKGRNEATVRVFQARYSDAELRAEAQRWIGSGLATDAYAKSDGSGVVVEVASGPAAAAPQLPGGAKTEFTVEYSHSAFRPLVGNAGAVPAVEQLSSTYWRWNDIAPWWGGSMYSRDTLPGCSAAFTVVDKEGYPGMLTAGHCGTTGGKIYKPGDYSHTPIGQVWWEWDYQDIALIWMYQSGAPRVYTGPWNSDYGRAVGGAASNYTGNYVCTSGAMSGEHCSIKVYYVSPSDVTVRANRTKSGACAAAHGDSGGPVITENPGAAFGKGIISSGSDAVYTCWAGNTQLSGYNRIMYKSLKFALNYFQATLRTSS
ncbi:S1 family peptidase [Micromonospora chersina]|uniref:S1 family peptidase n=1 Tax=Micromonospora chersina TaxID=47854 RepID=UPI0037136D77